MPEQPTSSRVRPLRPRPGARYTCFGDGLCCTDLHGLGPLTRREVRALSVISLDVVEPPSEDGFDEPMLRTRHDGGCLFLSSDRCELHAALGADAKPEGCRRFPLGLTATPDGGRITTRHRCPCRTLGDRPPVTVAAAAPSLLDRRGHLRADHRVGARVRLDGSGKRVPFAQYRAIEQDMLRRLDGGERPERVLDAEPFPKLRGPGWNAVATEMREDAEEDETRFGAALGWFAESILAYRTPRHRRTVDRRPWAEAFDRAEARTPTPESPEAILADWIADALWSLDWTRARGSLARGRADLATLLFVARDLSKRFRDRGLRADRAAAEAVTVVDLVSDSDWWTDVVSRIRA